MSEFVPGDRVLYLPHEAEGAPMPATVVGEAIRIGRLTMRQVRDEQGQRWTVQEDELTHPQPDEEER